MSCLCHLLGVPATQPGDRSLRRGPEGPDPSICGGNLPKECPEGSGEGVSLGKPFHPEGMPREEPVPCTEQCSARAGSHCWDPPSFPGLRSAGKLKSGKVRAGAGGVGMMEMRMGQGGRWWGQW